MPEQIIETLNKITKEKGGENYAHVLVEGINIGTLLRDVESKEKSDSGECKATETA